jgi:endoglucanase
VLAAGAGTRVFVDAGHAGWVQDLPALAAALRASGVERAAGFSLNVANFQTTADSVAYGERLSDLLGRAQFVVDVSRNGRGAPAAASGVDAWCNVPGAALGENPRVGADRALAVAFLWVKEPGASDGSCRPGEPAAGQFWPEYAERLVDQRP